MADSHTSGSSCLLFVLLIASLAVNAFLIYERMQEAPQESEFPPPPETNEYQDALLSVARSFSIQTNGKTARDIETDIALACEPLQSRDLLLSENELEKVGIVTSSDLCAKIKKMQETIASLDGRILVKPKQELE